MKQYIALRVWLLVNNCGRSGLGLWGLTPLSTIFQLYRAVVQISDLNVKIYIYIDLVTCTQTVFIENWQTFL